MKSTSERPQIHALRFSYISEPRPCFGEGKFNVTIGDVDYCLTLKCDEKKSFCDSQLDCIAGGGWLVEKPSDVNVETFYTSLAEVLEASSASVHWTGLSDLVGTNRLDATSGSSSFRISNATSNRLDRRCMAMTGSSNVDLGSCADKHCYICQTRESFSRYAITKLNF